MTRHLLPALALLAAPAAALALTPPHDATNGIECGSCHSVHSTGGNAFMPAGAVQEALCRSCHNPTGQAAAMSDVATHVVGGGARTLWCADCHDAHAPRASFDPHTGTTALNLSLVRADVSADVPGAPTVVFQRRPAHLAFGDAAQPWSGACQACHASTAHHTRDGAADHAHGTGGDCTTCHRHGRGFLAHCGDCHDRAQDDGDGVPAGGRRAVTPEFPIPFTGGHLAGDAAVRDRDCEVCHGLSRHQTGMVELLDPDGGAGVTFVRTGDLTREPDVSTFCLRCHDGAGAQRAANPLDPFGGGAAPRDVALQFSGTLQWIQAYASDGCYGASGTGRAVNSHHDVSDADQAFSGARLECLSCHSAHGTSRAAPVADPFDPLTAWTGSTTAFCVRCHAGGTGPSSPGFPAGVSGPAVALAPMASCAAAYQGAPWWIGGTYAMGAHGAGSKRGWPGYSGAPAHDLACTVCHDAHGSATPSNPAGNPYLIRDRVDGTPFVDDGARGAGWLGPPWSTVGVAAAVVVPVTPVAGGAMVGFEGLCATCHSQWQAPALFYHPDCFNCNYCHGHGQTFGEWDWVNGTAQQQCPP